MLSARYVWPGLAADAKAWCNECVPCHRGKTHVHARSEVIKIGIPQLRFSHVHVDIVGPLPPSPSGQRYLLTAIDRSTRWFEVWPLINITAEAALDAFMMAWVARFGVPARITTDRGTQFASGVWSAWCRSVGVDLIFTTAFHPQSNGMVERLHRQLKAALRARGGSWWEQLPWAVLGVRAAPKEESGVSAAEAALGQPLLVPSQPALPPVGSSSPPPAVIPPTSRSYAQAAGSVAKLQDVEWVYVRRDAPSGGPLAAAYEGPFPGPVSWPKSLLGSAR
jgi:transposase InsO family protein